MGRHSQTSSLNTTLVGLGSLASRSLTSANGHGRRRAEGPASTPLTPMLFRAGGVAAALSIAVSGGAYAAVSAQGGSDTITGGATTFGTLGAEAPGKGDWSKATVAEGGEAQVTTVTEDVTEARGTVEKQTEDLPEGETRVETEGADGVVRNTYQVTTVDGKEVSRQPVSSVVVSEKQDKVVLVGTGSGQQAQQEGSDSGSQDQASETPASPDPGAQAPDSGSGSAGAGSDPSPSPSADPESDEVWAALAQCESGGDPTANTGNGYYGLYQFSLSTWQAYGGTGLPSEASAAEQTAVAKRLQAEAGWGQWPHCAAQLGLL